MDESPLQSLHEDDAAALATILARAEATDGTMTWPEVRDAVDPATWGTLLAADVLVATGDAFVVDDPPAVQEALEDEDYEITTETGTDVGADGWRTIDKAAGLGTLVLVSGYQISAVKAPVVGAMDALLGPAAAVVPFPLLVLALSVGTASVSTVLRRRLLDSDVIDRHSDRTKALRERLKRARNRGDEAAIDRLEEVQRELVRGQFGILARSLRPMVWTMLLTVPIFLWLSWLVVEPSTAIAHATPLIPALDRIAWTARVLGPMRLWMVWYAVCQLASTFAVRRGLDRIENRHSITT